MSSATDLSYTDVYLGPWKDQSKSAVKGTNITVNSTDGVILVAFIALFIQFAGQHLWGIASFAWHQYRVSPRPRTALQYQQDTSLRNNASPGQTIWYFLQIAWAWRHVRDRGLRWWRLAVFPVVIPLLFLFLLLATGILSSKIVNANDVDILLDGKDCGVWQTPTQEMIMSGNSQYMIENHRYVAAVREFSRIYARRCYDQGSTSASPDCQIFTRTAVPYKSDLNASCPFDAETCVFSDGNLRMDTGLMDTKSLLGINTDQDRLQFRKVTTCSPLKPEFRTSRTNETDGDGIEGYHEYWNWGTLIGIGYDYIAEALSFDSTPFAGYSMITPRYYQISPTLQYPDQSSFVPIPEFNVSDGDVHMLFLEAHATDFAEPCDDPWFSAHYPYTQPTNTTTYFADYLLNPVGCVEQYAFCNPKAGRDSCTSLGGILPAAAASKSDLNLTSMQSAIVDILIDAIYANNVDIAQPVELLAQDSLVEGEQMPLPSNQWVLELQDMHNRALAQLQRLIVNYARGPGIAGAQQFIQKPEGEAKALCRMVRAKTSGQFSNVNTYGLAITLALGMLIILINMFLVDLVALLEKWRKVNSLRRERWIADGLLQLHSANIDTADAGPWEKTDGSVPVTQALDPVLRGSPAGPVSLRPMLTNDTGSQQSEMKGEKAYVDTRQVSRSGSESPVSPVSQTPVSSDVHDAEIGRA